MSPRPSPRPIRLDDIAAFVGGQVVGASDTMVSGVASLEDAGPEDLAYISTERLAGTARRSRAAAFIVGVSVAGLRTPQVVVESPAYAFALIVRKYFLAPPIVRGVADQVIRGADVSMGSDVSIWPFVTLGDRVRIGSRVTLFPGVFVGDDSSIGDDTVLYPNVTVREASEIGARVIIHSGTVIGSDGFGYIQHQGRHQKVPQIGTVTIEDDVELGANVTVDRASLGRTIIRRGTKVDNQVQIAHNVTIGEDSILVAQVGIAGSTTLGHHVMVGGQAGLVDHLKIGDRVRIAAGSGVAGDVQADQAVSGTPALAHEAWLKSQAVLSRLPKLREQVRDLAERLKRLEAIVQAPGSERHPRKQ